MWILLALFLPFARTQSLSAGVTLPFGNQPGQISGNSVFTTPGQFTCFNDTYFSFLGFGFPPSTFTIFDSSVECVFYTEVNCTGDATAFLGPAAGQFLVQYTVQAPLFTGSGSFVCGNGLPPGVTVTNTAPVSTTASSDGCAMTPTATSGAQPTGTPNVLLESQTSNSSFSAQIYTSPNSWPCTDYQSVVPTPNSVYAPTTLTIFDPAVVCQFWEGGDCTDQSGATTYVGPASCEESISYTVGPPLLTTGSFFCGFGLPPPPTSTSTTTTATTTTSSTASSSPTLPIGYPVDFPCAIDTPSRVFYGDVITVLANNTPANCIDLCASGSFFFAGVEYGQECHCGRAEIESIQTAGIDFNDVSECDIPCTGDPTQNCGGNFRIQIYADRAAERNAIFAPLPSTWDMVEMCAVDIPGRILEDDTQINMNGENTPFNCTTACQAAGFTQAGVEYGTECHCGTGLKSNFNATDPAQCSFPCSGDASLNCGGASRIIVYIFIGNL